MQKEWRIGIQRSQTEPITLQLFWHHTLHSKIKAESGKREEEGKVRRVENRRDEREWRGKVAKTAEEEQNQTSARKIRDSLREWISRKWVRNGLHTYNPQTWADGKIIKLLILISYRCTLCYRFCAALVSLNFCCNGYKAIKDATSKPIFRNVFLKNSALISSRQQYHDSISSISCHKFQHALSAKNINSLN